MSAVPPALVVRPVGIAGAEDMARGAARIERRHRKRLG